VAIIRDKRETLLVPLSTVTPGSVVELASRAGAFFVLDGEISQCRVIAVLDTGAMELWEYDILVKVIDVRIDVVESGSEFTKEIDAFFG